MPRALPSLYWVLNKCILNEGSVEVFLYGDKSFGIYIVKNVTTEKLKILHSLLEMISFIEDPE